MKTQQASDSTTVLLNMHTIADCVQHGSNCTHSVSEIMTTLFGMVGRTMSQCICCSVGDNLSVQYRRSIYTLFH